MAQQDEDARPVRPTRELRDSGLLWLINRVVFHPRGFALGVQVDQHGDVEGWRLLGDGTEVWQFNGDEDALYAAAEAELNRHRPGRS